MRAVIYDGYREPLRVTELAEPVPPDDGVVLRVEAAGLCRSDWHSWNGHDDDIPGFPHVPGHEFAGTVSAVGPDVTRWRVGDRVTTPFVCACGRCLVCESGNHQVCPHQWQPGFDGWGGFAEYVALPAADTNLVRLPHDMDMTTAAGLGCRVATAYRAIAQVGRAAPGEEVVVHGCGGVGLAAVMIARALGARVTAVDPSAHARELA
ncbi:MAG: alcohol dehydrogenase, partial [Actinomycetales bacterium mxb001]